MAGFRSLTPNTLFTKGLQGSTAYIPQTEHQLPYVGSVRVVKPDGEEVSVISWIDDKEGVFISSSIDLSGHFVRIGR